jgi:hypothetical protein
MKKNTATPTDGQKETRRVNAEAPNTDNHPEEQHGSESKNKGFRVGNA